MDKDKNVQGKSKIASVSVDKNLSLKFNSINDILEFAIARETEANRLYTRLAKEIAYPELRQLCTNMAQEELQHKAKLKLQLKEKDEAIYDFDASDYIVAGNVDIFMDYEELLCFVCRKEDVSIKLYTDLAVKVKDKNFRDVLLSLAREETEHKKKCKTEYENLLK